MVVISASIASTSSPGVIVSTSPLVVVSYKALAEQIERLSGQLRGAGLKPGEMRASPTRLDQSLIFVIDITKCLLFQWLCASRLM